MLRSLFSSLTNLAFFEILILFDFRIFSFCFPYSVHDLLLIIVIIIIIFQAVESNITLLCVVAAPEGKSYG